MITNEQVLKYFRGAEKNYPLSTLWVYLFQQRRGGYIDMARNQNLAINSASGEPSQAWHLITAWGENVDPSAPSSLSKLRSPELLLYVAEGARLGYDYLVPSFAAAQEEATKILAAKGEGASLSASSARALNKKFCELTGKSLGSAVDEVIRLKIHS